jgi:hypothetical protein
MGVAEDTGRWDIALYYWANSSRRWKGTLSFRLTQSSSTDSRRRQYSVRGRDSETHKT